MSSSGGAQFCGIKRVSRLGAVISWSFLLSILFVSQAFGAPSAVEDDADEAFDIQEETSNPHALALSEDGRLNGSRPLDGPGLDDQGDQVKFIFDWGDGTTSKSDFVDSGVNVSLSHNWSSEGVYSVRVRAEDTHGESSDWSEALEVAIIPKINRVSGSIRSMGL